MGSENASAIAAVLGSAGPKHCLEKAGVGKNVKTFAEWRWTIPWLILGGIAVVTVSPLSWRPDFGHTNIERFAGFGVLGAAFGVAYPRRLLLVALLIVATAAGLEALQLLIPDRDARISNFVLKAAGGIGGLLAAAVVNRWIAKRGRGADDAGS
jgi:hypothetical protein